MWCADNDDIAGRQSCNSDEECVANGRKICDLDSQCFGIMWYRNNLAWNLKLCTSHELEAAPKDNNGFFHWRTILKQGMYTIFLSEKVLPNITLCICFFEIKISFLF